MKPKAIQVQAADRKLQVGIEKHLSGAKSVVISGVAYKPSELVKLLQEEIDAADRVKTARLGWIAETKKWRQIQQTMAPLKRLLRAYVITTFGETSNVLVDFGIEVRKSRKKLTLGEKVLVVDKSRATRAARTMGKRRGQKVAGDVPSGSEHEASAPSAGTTGPNGSALKAAPSA